MRFTAPAGYALWCSDLKLTALPCRLRSHSPAVQTRQFGCLYERWAGAAGGERERERESWEVVVRDTTILGGGRGRKQYFRFEGSQALPASPSDRGEA
jgi:hypothetical protein